MATNESRSKERPWLLPKIQDVVKQFPQSEVAERCERANVSFAPVGEPADLFEDIHLLKSNGLLDVFVSPQLRQTFEIVFVLKFYYKILAA